MFSRFKYNGAVTQIEASMKFDLGCEDSSIEFVKDMLDDNSFYALVLKTK